jgi:hypothetical protein
MTSARHKRISVGGDRVTYVACSTHDVTAARRTCGSDLLPRGLPRPLPFHIFKNFFAGSSESQPSLRLLISKHPRAVVAAQSEVAMRHIVLIYDDADEGQFADRFDAFPARSLAPTHAVASARRPSAWVLAAATWRSRAFRREISRLRSIARRPLIRWFAAPILGVPSVYSGYSAVLNFWHGIGVSPSLWLHILAVAAGVASGLAVITRLRT